MSEKYIVSALKYRPQNFDTVIGQNHITTTLKNAIKTNHLAHSFLFCGPRGVGKTTTARILAKTINCESLTEDTESCDNCTSCKAFNSHQSYNVYELDAASNNSVDDIRQLIEGVKFAPQRGKFKIYIIDEVHMLSGAAFNAFLKTLEEPPAHAIFILATTEKHKILPTILSRCQIFDFKRITIDDSVDHLQKICDKENVQAEREALQVVAQKSEGCMRDALSLMDKLISFNQGKLIYKETIENLNILDYDVYFELNNYILEQKVQDVLLLFDKILKKGFEEVVFLQGLILHFRNVLVSYDERSKVLLEMIESASVKYQSEAQKFNVSFILSAINLLTECDNQMSTSNNRRLLTELYLIKLCYLNNMLGISSETNNLEKVTQAHALPYIKKISTRYNKRTFEKAATLENTIRKNDPPSPSLHIEKNIKEEKISSPISTKDKESVAKESTEAGTTSIVGKGGLKNLASKLKTLEVIEEVKSPDPIDISNDKLLLIWSEILDYYKNKNLTIFARLEDVKVYTDQEQNINFEFYDKMSYPEITSPETIDILREKLVMTFHKTAFSFKHHFIQKEIKVDSGLSRIEIFERFAQSNPWISKLKNDLGLEIDYNN